MKVPKTIFSGLICPKYTVDKKFEFLTKSIDLHKEPGNTNRISPVIDCCYAKMCHYPVNLSTARSQF